MSDQLRLERNLPGLLEDLYVAGTPDYRNDVLAAAARNRQRPAWTFPERWIPVVDIALPPAFAGRFPARAITLALLVLALVAAGLVFYVGSQQRELPAPFGLASNGGVVYALDGDLYVGDPATGTSRAIVTGAGLDRKPVVSPDGTHVAFLRGADGSTDDSFDLMVASFDGSNVSAVSRVKVSHNDPFAWSPDGSFILLTDGDGDTMRYPIGGGTVALLASDVLIQAGAFQPPDGGAVLYEQLSGDRALGLMNADGTAARIIYTIPLAEQQDGCDFGTVSWSPDGHRIAFLRHPAGTEFQCRVFVMKADGTDAHQVSTQPGLVTETDLRWSPDGTQIAIDRWLFDTGNWLIQPIGVVPAAGGEPRSIGPTPVSDGAAFEWAPDGRSIISVAGTVVGWPPSSTMSNAKPMVIDVASGEATEASWSISSWPSWQRLAPSSE